MEINNKNYSVKNSTDYNGSIYLFDQNSKRIITKIVPKYCCKLAGHRVIYKFDENMPLSDVPGHGNCYSRARKNNIFI